MTTLRQSAGTLTLGLSLVLLCASQLMAQNPPQPIPAPQLTPTPQAPIETRTGCLTAGSRPGAYLLVVDMSGEQLNITGAAIGTLKLDQKVVATGTTTRNVNGTVFEATKIDPANAPCQVGFSMDSLKKSIGHARIGIRGGVGFDPDLINLGAQAEFGPLLRTIWFRPTAEFGFGEVTKVGSINPEFVYYLPFTGYGKGDTRWNSYVGSGPSITIARRDFSGFPDNPTESISDWDTDVGLNVFVGVAQSSGLFFELKGTAYTIPAIRLYLGYTFK